MSTTNSAAARDAILRGLPRGLHADNLLDIAKNAKALAQVEQYNVATWALIHLGFVALASYWDDPVDADVAEEIGQRIIPACEEAIRNPTTYATEKLARELIAGLARLSSYR